ncbi:ATP-binding protein [Geodermatophilus sp. URMC 64]
MAGEPAGPGRSSWPGHRALRILRPWRGTSVRREIVLFISTAVCAFLAVGTGAYVFSGKIARDTALLQAERSADRIASYIVGPLLSRVLAGEPEDRRDLDQVVAATAGDGTVTAVLVWRDDGTIVYASDPDLEGQRLPLSEDLAAAIDGRVVSGFEPRSEVYGAARGARPYLEVYTPLRLTGRDERYVLEVYFDTSRLDRDAALLRARIVPVAIGALVVLQAAQIPIAVSLARRLRRHEAERIDLLERHLAGSDRERREIAAGIHDGPVQDLAGVSYALTAMAPTMSEEAAGRAARLGDAVRRAVASLRHLMVDMYPPDLSGAGLATALQHLADPLRDRGVSVHVEGEAPPGTSSLAADVLYRVAKEALVNVGRHASARTVLIRLEDALMDGRAAVRMTVSDDGVGFPPAPPGDRRRTPRGRSLGLQSVRYRVVQAGGTVAFGNREDGGAEIDVLLPADSPDTPAVD